MKKLFLFDIDGTLTLPRKKISNTMQTFLANLKQQHDIGIVGGSDFPKAQEQIGVSILQDFHYVFSENGLVFYRDGHLIHQRSLTDFLSRQDLHSLISFALHYIADLDIPVKTGTFVEYRNAMLNISPIGRNCSQEQRNAFELYDNQHKIRLTMIQEMKKQFQQLNLDYSIGGQISFDVFPKGLNKTYCLDYIHGYDEIHFFGDKTFPGGNDYEIYNDPRVIGHRVENDKDTIRIVSDLLHF